MGKEKCFLQFLKLPSCAFVKFSQTRKTGFLSSSASYYSFQHIFGRTSHSFMSRDYVKCYYTSTKTAFFPISSKRVSTSLDGGVGRIQLLKRYSSTKINEESSQVIENSVSELSAKIAARPASKINTQDGVEVVYFRGLPQITVPLPSRQEKCRFILKPLTNSVGDLLHMIQNEDKGIDRISAQSEDGIRIASSNTIEMLMEQNFNLIINDTIYHVVTPPQEKPSTEDLDRLYSVRNLVGQLYAALNVDEHQLRQERELVSELEKLSAELVPLEEKKSALSALCSKRTNILSWVGLGLMSVQFGVLARLTWCEYSWDIMEPVTYFVTYGTAMLAYAYFVLTKQDYVLPEVRDRQYLIAFHKNARKHGLDVKKYNELRTKAHKIENDLQRLRDPLSLHLPLKNSNYVGNTMLGTTSYSSSATSLLEKAQLKLQRMIQKTSTS